MTKIINKIFLSDLDTYYSEYHSPYYEVNKQINNYLFY